MNESRRFYLTVAATKVLASVAEDQPTLGRALCLMFKEQVLGEEAHLDGESPEVCTVMHILALTPYPSPRQKENKQESVPHTPYKEINKEKTHTPPEPTLAVADLFKKFWSAYPRKVGKTTCLSKFERIFKGKAPAEQRSLLERMLSAIATQSRSSQWQEDERYIPHPTTWLNQGRWEDEGVAPQRSQADIERELAASYF